jgi:predicted RNA-binding Zn-ribbon protein involved in translation (DUF1610 family)
VKKEERKLTKTTQPNQMYTIDLARIEGNGDFSCPNCGVMISPEDETESVYTILETKMKEGGSQLVDRSISEDPQIEELTIQCNKCGSKIRLIGFAP